jgi:magnesium-protoporphyrin IX monomethyl ester (oxidative) cyclase
MIWKFNKVYNADRQYADHQREVRYQLPPPAAQPGPVADQKNLFIHVPQANRLSSSR